MTRTIAEKNESRLHNLIALISDMQDGTAAGTQYVAPLESGHFLLKQNENSEITISFEGSFG